MANPFQAQRDSECNDCGAMVNRGEDMFYDNGEDEGGEFICEECAEYRGIICDCGKKKKSHYQTCWECKAEEFE